MTKVIKDPYMGWMYLGNTMVDIHGYGQGEICDAYITDTDISVWEMIHYLGGTEKFLKEAEKAYEEFKSNPWSK
jgi:hypothetical protein